MNNRVDVLGVGFDDISLGQAVARACESIKSGKKTYVVTPNPEIVWMSRRNDNYRSILNNAGLVLADGVGIILGARILGTPLKGGRVPGIEFAEALFEEMAKSGGTVFLLLWLMSLLLFWVSFLLLR
jgi:N-acetylglucosaminyldiphosphoundecaprenol N-acetyl-beta-D-mannosaminyltransferase